MSSGLRANSVAKFPKSPSSKLGLGRLPSRVSMQVRSLLGTPSSVASVWQSNNMEELAKHCYNLHKRSKWPDWAKVSEHEREYWLACAQRTRNNLVEKDFIDV